MKQSMEQELVILEYLVCVLQDIQTVQKWDWVDTSSAEYCFNI